MSRHQQTVQFTIDSTMGSVSVPTATKCLTAGPTIIPQLLEITTVWSFTEKRLSGSTSNTWGRFPDLSLFQALQYPFPSLP